MYGSEKTDLLVKYYDQSIGISGKDELSWYLQKARSAGGPVLDLACGTGRLALMLAREGFEVTGIDQSVGMLNQFKKKLLEEPEAVKRRIHIENQRMSAFSLEKKFNTILCCDAFFHNLTVKDEIACLEHVAQHLTPTGRFLFNLRDPTCDFLHGIAVAENLEFKERGHYVLDDGSATLIIEQAESVNLPDQCIYTSLRFTKYDPEGKVVEEGESSWTSRYLFRYEAIHLLYRCGFVIRALVGDYNHGPVIGGGQLIFDTQLNEGLAV